jgi:hypothetical protein
VPATNRGKDMDLRERFLEVMDFNLDVRAPKWELAYWGQTIDNWYSEGLPKKKYPQIPKEVSTITVSLYNKAWTSGPADRLPRGIAVIGGGVPSTQNFPVDEDVMEALGMDQGQEIVDVNLLFCPMYDVEVIEENENYFKYVDLDGITRLFLKESEVIPTSIKYVISDRKTWEKTKSERLSPNSIKQRFPANWGELVKRYKNRRCPLMLGGYPYGYFGTLAHIMGYEKLFLTYYDDPALIHDIQSTFTDIWLAAYEEVFSQIDVDYYFIWEDMSSGKGSMISPEIIREFMLPYYKKLTGFLKAHGVKTIFVDTDGDCHKIIPLIMEGGVTGLLPIEVSCGMDLLKVRKDFPALRVLGGIPKQEIQYGRGRIDEILVPVAESLKLGGYIPTGDHFIPPEVHWEEFVYYRKRLNAMIDKAGRI